MTPLDGSVSKPAELNDNIAPAEEIQNKEVVQEFDIKIEENDQKEKMNEQEAVNVDED